MWTVVVNEPAQVLIIGTSGVERLSTTAWHQRMGGWRGVIRARKRGERIADVSRVAFDPRVTQPTVNHDEIGQPVLIVGTDFPLSYLASLEPCSNVWREIRRIFADDRDADLAASYALGKAVARGYATVKVRAVG